MSGGEITGAGVATGASNTGPAGASVGGSVGEDVGASVNLAKSSQNTNHNLPFMPAHWFAGGSLQ